MILLQKQKKGFSLVEISMVLLAIALIMSSVALANSLIMNAKYRALIREGEDYMAALAAFKEIYNAFPGDLYNASTVLDASALNGNGDNIIGTNLNAEVYYVWQHLMLAGLVGGKYNGNNMAVSSYMQVPWSFWHHGETLYGNWGYLAKASLNFSRDPFVYGWGHSISPVDVYAIDRKIDDGLPATGKVLGFSIEPTNCVRDANGTGVALGPDASPTGAGYDLTNNARICAFLFWHKSN